MHFLFKNHLIDYQYKLISKNYLSGPINFKEKPFFIELLLNLND